MDALAIVIHDDSAESDSDVNIDDLDGLEKINISGSAFEMKVEKINQAASMSALIICLVPEQGLLCGGYRWAN